jgi:uncharacterized damage-inducible protein DinB
MNDLDHLLDRQLEESFAMYDELVAALSSSDLERTLPVPSNTIGSQLWCVVGARESWARAIAKGAWDGFSCSLTSINDLDAMRPALAGSAAAVQAASAAAGHDAQRTELKLRLLVHESQHQGQLLRYLLGLKLPVPPRWRERFALGAEG